MGTPVFSEIWEAHGIFVADITNGFVKQPHASGFVFFIL
jgi:hypothetical protein